MQFAANWSGESDYLGGYWASTHRAANGRATLLLIHRDGRRVFERDLAGPTGGNSLGKIRSGRTERGTLEVAWTCKTINGGDTIDTGLPLTGGGVVPPAPSPTLTLGGPLAGGYRLLAGGVDTGGVVRRIEDARYEGGALVALGMDGQTYIHQGGTSWRAR